MSNIFYLPDLGEGLPDAEICQWYVKEGDIVKTDDLLVSMETAKAVVDVPSPYCGKIVKLYGQASDIIKTGAPLVEFLVESDAVTSGHSEIHKDKGTVVGSMEETDTIITESATGIELTKVKQMVKALPAVRVLARHLSVDIGSISASGAHGEVTVEDVKQAAMIGSALTLAKTKVNLVKQHLETRVDQLRGVRRSMANAMSQSHAEVVPVTLVDDANISAWPKGTDITVRVIRALVYACHIEPALNAHFDQANLEIKRHSEVNIGIAMDSKDGLFVPVIKNAQSLDGKQVRSYIERFKSQVADRSIPQDDLKGCTIQLSNFGTFAGRYANPIVVPPIVAILGTGRIRDEVVAIEHKIAIHRILPLSLTIDHRAVTGGEAARFLAALIEDLSKSH